jgi:transposase
MMTKPSDLQLEQATHSELVEMVRLLFARVESLEKEIQLLREENVRLNRPKPNSRNSSQPPSRDQKPNSSKDQPRKKHGPPFGHKRFVRSLVENPDKVILVDVDQCASCQHDLTGTEPSKVVRRQVTELPEIKPIVLETQQTEKTCPNCHHLNRAELPAGLEADRFFGPRLEATVVFLKHQNHFSYERIVNALREIYGLEISEGGISAIIARAGNLASAEAAEIREAVKSSAVIQSDETSARVKKRNYWHWVFLSESGVYHQIVSRRNAEVILDLMEQSIADVWVSDCFSAQMKAPANNFQLCLQHQLRDLKRILERLPESAWAAQMRRLFREAIHLKNRMSSSSSDLTQKGFHRRVSEIGNRLDRLLEDQLTDSDEIRLQNRFLLHREKLLTFLDYPDVPPTNNASEQAIRTSVIHRKVTNGFRSEWGAKAYADLLSVISTSKIKGKSVYETLVRLMGSEVLPFLHA